MTTATYGSGTLSPAIRSRMMTGVNGLDIHILEAGYETSDRPLALLLHGFPDLAFGWRHLMPLLAEAGYHVVAPDARGFGRTTGVDTSYDAPLEPFSLLNLLRDALGLVLALGHKRTAMLVGHDLGSPVAAYGALIRPDVFPSLVLLSAPFPGPPAYPPRNADGGESPDQQKEAAQKLAADLAALDPPREYYQQYLSGRQANEDLWNPPQGLPSFLRTFFYVKSGNWTGNQPHPLKDRSAAEFAQMPTYYVMERTKTMAENVAPYAPTEAQTDACSWLTEPELNVYAEEFGRTGFQGALQAYRVFADAALGAELRLFAGRTIDVPCLFIGGSKDWATYSAPGALELMQTKATTKMAPVQMIDGAGHWIQQEKPAELAKLLHHFVAEHENADA